MSIGCKTGISDNLSKFWYGLVSWKFLESFLLTLFVNSLPAIFGTEKKRGGKNNPLKNQFLMDIWWSNHFKSKGLESSNWNKY